VATATIRFQRGATAAVAGIATRTVTTVITTHQFRIIMDKKSILFGIGFLIAGLGLMMYNTQQHQKAQMEAMRQAEEAARAAQIEGADTGARGAGAAAPDTDIGAIARPVNAAEIVPADGVAAPIPPIARPVGETTAPASGAAAGLPEERYVLENDELVVHFTNRGGAISRIELKNHPEVKGEPEPVVLNSFAEEPALGISRALGTGYAAFAPVFQLQSQTDDQISFVADIGGGLSMRRVYAFVPENGPGSRYTLRHTTEFINSSDEALSIDRIFINVGTAAPTDADRMGFNLNASYRDAGDYGSIPSSKFRGGGFIFKSEPKDKVEQRGSIEWGAVKNQFFVTIVTPDQPAAALIAKGVDFPVLQGVNGKPIGITALMEFAVPTLAPGSTQAISFDYYAGPKNFQILSRMDRGQEDTLQLGWFLFFHNLGLISLVAKMLLSLMGMINGVVANYGVTIILTTLVIRLVLWPLTAKAAKASKRMQKLSKPMQELREKYKDNPQKLNEEMMKIWKEHGINPLSGCWPVLIQFPIFIGFFNLLRNSADLRFAEFLWIGDLSMPDATIRLGDASLPFIGNTINVLPFVWLVTMWFQMKTMPTPSVDNAQVKIMKWMPFIFFPFTYFFSSGLVLYWTTTNAFSILQQYLTNRTRDEEDAKIEAELREMEDRKAGKITGPLISKKRKKKPNN